MKTVSLKLPAHVLQQLEIECKQRRISKSALIRESLDDHFRSARQSRKNSALDLIRDLVVSAKNAPRDLSTNPKYMEGYGE